jgi:nicotinate-nucleotide pyrophosphorylase (carboxylating)
MIRDIQDDILQNAADKKVTAAIVTNENGVVAGTDCAVQEAQRLDLTVQTVISEGSRVTTGDHIIRFCGNPKQVVMAEDILIGLIAKPSGIATAASRFIEKAGKRLNIVSGGWKKMPPTEKDMIRCAIAAGGASFRISREPFLYLDKNYTAILGGIRETLAAVAHLRGFVKVIQLKGRYGDIAAEAMEAVTFGADILFIDTGFPDDVVKVSRELIESGTRSRVRIAFGGGITLDGMDALTRLDIDIIDIGRQIVDAPLLDIRLEVLNVE